MRLTPSISIMKRQRLLNPRNLEVARRMAVMTPGAFRIIRKGRGLSGHDVSQLVGLSESAISLMERGLRQLPDSVAGLIYACWLLDPRNEPKAEP